MKNLYKIKTIKEVVEISLVEADVVYSETNTKTTVQFDSEVCR